MILPDDTSDTLKTPVLESPPSSRPEASQSTLLRDESPPAYYGSTYMVAANVPQPKFSTRTRFYQAFFAAVLALLFLGGLLRALISFTSRSRDWEDNDTQWDYDIPSGLALSDCIQGSEWITKAGIYGSHNMTTSLQPHKDQFDYSSHSSFTLPLNSDILSILARGQASSGSVKVATSPKQHKDEVTVMVYVSYILESTRNRAKVCKFATKVGRVPNGVGIFTPRWRGWSNYGRREESLAFDTTIIFPEVRPGQPPLHVTGLTLDAPLSSYKFADLNEKLSFDSLTLKGSSASIEAESLSARSANIGTRNGAIRGTFNVTESLVMATTNNEIYVNVGLDGPDSLFTAVNTNSPIEAQISLINTSPSLRPKYLVSATTTNSNLRVRVMAQPADSTLDLTAGTTNGPAELAMHPAFEGTFQLRSSTAIVVREHQDVRDPRGQGRDRRVHYTTHRTGEAQVVSGTVLWGEDEDSAKSRIARNARRTTGTVAVRNTNAPLTFEL